MARLRTTRSHAAYPPESVYAFDAASATVGGKLVAVPLGGGTAAPLFDGKAGSYWSIAADDTSVYWTEGDQTSGSVLRIAKGGGAATILAGGQATPTGVAVDAKRVYWCNVQGGTLMSVAK